jgi:hypothetical protein
MAAPRAHLLTSQTLTSPVLSRLVWLAEQLTGAADELAVLIHNEQVRAALSASELVALRQAAAGARTAGGDVVLLASAAHDRVAQDPAPA